MGIKSLEDLKKIREDSLKKVNLRETGKDGEDITELMVGMATCGIAAGARVTLAALLDEITKNNVENIRVVQVGCLGYCHSEPIVQINQPGKEPILYGNVDDKKARDIINKHVLKNELLDDSIIINTFQKA
ncbi:MAG: (2Fe-2S) ferredoxin domain-containing protein [Eubacteriales bacterium]|jgi:NADP-reducing hydrogenase subunit HndB|nr:(2Fe-2S) ferredoxin domain-containing protein [Eubacteriales bacterium]